MWSFSINCLTVYIYIYIYSYVINNNIKKRVLNNVELQYICIYTNRPFSLVIFIYFLSL